MADNIPQGFRYLDEPTPPGAPFGSDLPPGFVYLDTPAGSSQSAAPASSGAGAPSKTERFLQGFTVQGPISGLMGLVRSAGQAAQGQRPDLLTNPEGAIPESVWGGLPLTGQRGAGPILPIEQAAAARTRAYQPPSPEAPMTSAEIAQIAPPRNPSQMGAAEFKQFQRRNDLFRELGRPPTEQELVNYNARRDAQLNQRELQDLQDTGSKPAIEVRAQPGQTPYQMIPPETVKEFRAVQQGIALREALNPGSQTNISARDAAVAQALKPHINSITAVGRRTTAPEQALETNLPAGVLQDALNVPGKAASLANWMRVYERAAKAGFSPQAKASLGLATRNLNSNLGTELTLEGLLPSSGGP